MRLDREVLAYRLDLQISRIAIAAIGADRLPVGSLTILSLGQSLAMHRATACAIRRVQPGGARCPWASRATRAFIMARQTELLSTPRACAHAERVQAIATAELEHAVICPSCLNRRASDVYLQAHRARRRW